MWVVAEVHQVVGRCAAEFERTFRRAWAPALEKGGEARVLLYADHAHLTCFAYHVLTWTAVPDGAAWLRLAERVHAGDLLEPARALDPLRHDVEARLLRPEAAGDPAELARGVAASGHGETALFVEDTFRASGRFGGPPDDGITEPGALLRVAHPALPGDEFVSWRRVRHPDRLLASLTEAAAPSPLPGAEHVESKLWRVGPYAMP